MLILLLLLLLSLFILPGLVLVVVVVVWLLADVVFGLSCVVCARICPLSFVHVGVVATVTTIAVAVACHVHVHNCTKIASILVSTSALIT